MTRLELKALMAAQMASGMLSTNDPRTATFSHEQFAHRAVVLAEAVLHEVEQRSTSDDNNALWSDTPTTEDRGR